MPSTPRLSTPERSDTNSPSAASSKGVAAGLVLALSYLGGEAAQSAIGVSDKAVRAFQGMLLFFVLACDTLIHYRVRIVGAPIAKAEPVKAGEAVQNA